MTRRSTLLFGAALALALAACQGGTSASDTTDPAAAASQDLLARRPVHRKSITVSLTPGSTTVQRKGKAGFSATVSGTSNVAVSWAVTEPGGGTVDANGVYTAPDAVGTFHVQATSAASSAATALAAVTVVEASTPAPVTVAVTPSSATVYRNGTFTFAGAVSNATDGSVTWSVVEAGGGSVSAGGVYTAPDAVGTFHVVATSVASAAASASATVTVLDPPAPVTVSVTPSSATVYRKGTFTFAAAVTGTAVTTVTWSVVEAGGGSVSTGGVYTAPDVAGTFHVRARSTASTTSSATATVTVLDPPAPVSVTVAPSSATVYRKGTYAFTATVANATSTAVAWSVAEAGGGSVSTAGLYTAPDAVGTFHVVATSAASAAASASATVTVVEPPVTPPATSDLIPASRRTTWAPGIPGGTPRYQTVHVTLKASDYGNGASDAAAAINAAIRSAGAVATAASPRVVLLSAGTFSVNSSIVLDQDWVSLRGAGPDPTGSGAGTRLVSRAVDTNLLFMGNYTDWWSGSVNVVGSVAKGSSSFTLTSGHGVQAGDLLVIDKVDDAMVTLGGGQWWKRGPNGTDNGPPSAAWRSIGQVVEVTAVSGDVVTIAGILHQAYPASLSPQVFGSADRRRGWSGVGLEDMTISGWGDAYGVYANWLRRSFVSRVEFDGRPAAQGGVGTGTRGDDVRFFRSVRVAIEGSYLHHSRSYQTNNNAYGISLACQTSDALVQDNIVWFKNKNITLEASGGGNVIAYNYVEDPVINDPVSTSWLEQGIDGSHLSHPSMDLFEGNHTAKMGAADTHGSAGQQTFFRNYSKGNRLYTMSDNAAVAAVLISAGMREMNLVGNVLATRPGGIYEAALTSTGWLVTAADMTRPKIFSLGFTDGEWSGPADLRVAQELLRVGNYDAVRGRVDTAPSQPLPDSLYLSAKPAFFGAYAWPWVEPTGTNDAERVKTLPAKARFDTGRFF